jgi:AcrR family transcriptional regulator
MAQPMSSTSPSLRERKQDLARDIILEAAAELVLEQGVQGFSIQNVADRAGVSHRTIYRYFATRQQLLDALDEWVEAWRRELGGLMPERAEDVAAFASMIFARYEERQSFFLAASMLELGAGAKSTARAQRTEQARRMFDAALPHLPADERRRSFAVLRHLISVHTWQILRTQYGLTGEESGPVVARVVELIVEDLGRRDREAHPGAGPVSAAE